MEEEAAARLHGLAQGEGNLESFRTSASSTSDSSFRSSAAWSADDDGDDYMYRLRQSEYEEIPSFRWIPSPLRWWKERRTRKRTHLSIRSDPASAASKAEEPGPAAVTEAESGGETRNEMMHLGDHLVFTIDEFLDSAEVLGRGIYGTMYKARLGNGNVVAVRRLYTDSVAIKRVETIIKALGEIRHPNLLGLRSFYCSEDEQLLVFDYMPHGNLSSFLHDRHPDIHMDWPTRMNIAIGITTGLHYLHTYKNMVHGNLTSTNILVDDHKNAKITDYGRLILTTTDIDLLPQERVLQYRAMKNATTKTDVYSLGVVMLELLTSKSPKDEIEGLDFLQWVISLVGAGRAHEALDPGLMEDAVTMGDGLLHTLHLGLQCVDSSPHVRPEPQQVLQQLKQIEQATSITIVAPTTGTDISSPSSLDMVEGRTPSLEDHGSTTSDFYIVSANDGTLEVGISEDITSSPIVSPTSSGEAMFAPINSGASEEELEELAESISQVDLNEEAIQGHSWSKEPQSPNLPDIEVTSRLGSGSAVTDIEATAQGEGSNGLPTSSLDHMDEVQCLRKKFLDATCSPRFFQFPNVGQTQTTQDADPRKEVEGVSVPLPIADTTGERLKSEVIDATSRGTAIIPPPVINWGEVTLEARLEVPTSPPLISCEPDLGYQRFFQTLYDLAHYFPPLPSTVLQVQLNRMVMGLHSLGYPMGTWLKAATFVLVSAEKREHMERHVDDYKIYVEARLAEFASVTAALKEEMSRTQSSITTLEQRREQLDETIAKLEDQLGVLKARREEVVDSLATARDQLVVARGRMDSVSADRDQLNQQHSAISDWRSAMLRELPSLDDEVFDSSFRETLTTKF